MSQGSLNLIDSRIAILIRQCHEESYLHLFAIQCALYALEQSKCRDIYPDIEEGIKLAVMLSQKNNNENGIYIEIIIKK